jgi:ankyrin repeat protein
MMFFQDMLVLMLNYGTEAMLTDGNGETILHHACKNNDEALLKVLMERKVPLDTKDDLGKTALLHAAENGHNKLVKLMLDARADPKIGNKWNAVALHYACANNHLHSAVTILKAALLRPPSGVFMTCLRNNKSKLFDENVEMVNLLKEECCIDDVDVSGETPLFKACYRGHTKIVRALLDRGADYTIKAGEYYPFDFLKPGKELESLERLAAKVSRFVVRIKYENSIDLDKTDVLDSIVVKKAKQVTALTELTSDADRDAFHKFAVIEPADFEINIRDISNKLRLLSLRRLDIIKESKALCAGPYLYHKSLKGRIIRLVEEGFDAYKAGNSVLTHDRWEEATQLQCLKDWVASVLLKDKPVEKDTSDRLFNILRLHTLHQQKKAITHAERLQLQSRVEATLASFDNNNKEYAENDEKKMKKKKKKKKKNTM